MAVNISGGFKEVAKSMPFLKTIAIEGVLGLLIVGVIVASTVDINVSAGVGTAMTAIETGMAGWMTKVIVVVGIIVGLITLTVIMKLFQNKKKGDSV